MNLYIDNHKFHYEMENLCRAFLFTENVAVIHEFDRPEAPYILTSVHDEVRVELCAGDMHKALLACVIRQDGRTVTVKTPEGTCFAFAEDGSGCVNGVPVDTTHLDQVGEMSVLPHANVL